MRVISLESSMTAITFISAPHFGHTKGSTSYTLARRLITGAFAGVDVNFHLTRSDRFVATVLSGGCS